MGIVDQRKIFARAGRAGDRNPPGRRGVGTTGLFNRV